MIESAVQIPVVDLRGETATTDLDHAWRNVGFVSVVGHGIGQSHFEEMRSLLVELFALDDEVKRRYRITPDNYRGFIPLGFFTPNRGEVTGTTPDAYEAFKLHWECPDGHPALTACPLYGRNRWVPEVDRMAEVVSRYWSACDSLGRTLLDAVASSLGVHGTTLHAMFDAPLTNMTLMHYPAMPPGADFGIHPHRDTNIFTLLHPDPVGGLQVQDRDGEWITVACPPDAMVVNVGEMLELLSGGHFVATPHRVVNLGPDRYSFPYFMVPDHDVVVEPLVPPRPGFETAPMPVGELTNEVWRTNWPDELPSESDYALGSLGR